jgi:hypothetical protein
MIHQPAVWQKTHGEIEIVVLGILPIDELAPPVSGIGSPHNLRNHLIFYGWRMSLRRATYDFLWVANVSPKGYL